MTMPVQLSNRLSFWVTSGVVAHILWTSAAPAMAYPLYAQQWGLTPTATTAVYAIYPIVVVAVLVFFGNISDHIGQRRTMVLGLLASSLGVLLFGMANGVAMLFAGRILMGVGVGLSAGPSSAALLEYAGSDGSQRASTATIVGQAAGFAAALLVGGFLTQYAPFPTRLSFFVLFALLVALLVAVFFLREAARSAKAGRWRPRLPYVPVETRGRFLFAAFTVMTAYAHGVTIASLGAQIAKDLVHSTNVFSNGLMLSLFPLALGATALLTRSADATRATIIGAVLSIIGAAFLTGAVLRQSLVLFAAATAVSGAAYAFMVYGGFSLIGSAAPGGSRGGILSAIYLIAYLYTGVLALVLGRIATLFGMTTAAITGAATMSLLCGCLVLWALGGLRKKHPSYCLK